MTISSVSSQSSVNARITPQQVSPAVLKQATDDGDGKTGIAALNDGDTAAQRAAQQVRSSVGQHVDIKV